MRCIDGEGRWILEHNVGPYRRLTGKLYPFTYREWKVLNLLPSFGEVPKYLRMES